MRIVSALVVGLAVGLAGCPKKLKQTEPAVSVLRWTDGEGVALIHGKEGVMARAVHSGRSRILRAGLVDRVVLDTERDLVWIQAQSTLEVIDLREGGAVPLVVAIGTPPGVPIEVLREVNGRTHTSMPEPSGCVRDSLVKLTWSETSKLEIMSAENGGAWRDLPGITLAGAVWLRAQINRPSGDSKVKRIDFPFSGPHPALLPASELHCDGTPMCGASVPFDRTGLQLVVTGYEEGDCQHFTCHLYDPATKKVNPASACGPFRFDRAGEHYLIADTLCAARGDCQHLDAEAAGWVSGGVTVGVGD